jgi:protocatechuate 3,4-dioxygenase beta subunit
VTLLHGARKAERAAGCVRTRRGFAPRDGRRVSPLEFTRITLFLILASHLWAQTAPARFRVSGKVVNAVNGHPIANAEVWLGNADEFETTQQKLLTGDDGVFAFTVADPGKYTISGQASGFRRQGFEQHGMYSSAIVVKAGLNTENIVFQLRPDARLMGVVEDDDHEPIGNATIYLFRSDASLGLRQTSLTGQTTSDDRGHYRFAHLEPGVYYLAVSASPWFSGLLQQADAPGISALTQKREFDIAFPTTFYPGVTDMASASQLALNEGADFTADFTLSAVPALRVKVDYANANGEKPANVGLRQKIFDTEINATGLRQSSAEDSFEIRGAAPGRYALQLVSVGSSNVQSQRSTLINLTEDAEVDAESVAAVAPIHGVVRMQRGLKPKEQGYVRLWNSRDGEVLESTISDKGDINFDGDFLTTGTYSVFAMSGTNSIVSSLKATGAQVAGQTVQITGGKSVELEIEMASTLSKITGIVRRDKKPVVGAMILLVPEDAEINMPKFRRDQSDSDGTFTLQDVLPGRYWVMAIEDGWDLEWANLSLLKKRLEHAQKIEVQGTKSYPIVLEVE